ncbi:cutinase family protein [Nocardia blacklockiae]|uniref:cutinase family protein n=1 Tax=Nocardia blacklockiae TaxID=480036 RepID=UPI001893DA47|nr:cutinase family protein [Nocardia blacklockiae]MBF6176468.1 cutinase family protein [Nocardia blacklockiae]
MTGPVRVQRTTIVRASAALTAAAAIAAGTLLTAAAPARAATCTDVEVVAARGSMEPSGSIADLGIAVGQPVYEALSRRLRVSHSAHGIDYPADFNQPYSVQQGNRKLVRHITEAAAACPNQRFVLVGYSQGANVIDNSIGISSAGAKVGGPIVATLPPSVESKIAAILLFGNPIRGVGRSVTGPYADRTYDTCSRNDPVCEPGGTDWNVHRTSYTRKADEAAEFAVDRL